MKQLILHSNRFPEVAGKIYFLIKPKIKVIQNIEFINLNRKCQNP